MRVINGCSQKQIPLGMGGWRLSHFVKSVLIRSFFGPYFPAFGANTERYRVSLRIQSE